LHERIPPLRQKVGGKRSPSPWVMLFIWLFFLGMFLVLFLRSPLLKIQHITIKGNHLLPTKEIIKAVQFQRGQPYFLVDEAQFTQKIERLPGIHKVEVSKQFPNQLQIQVQEYSILAYVERSDQMLIPLLSNGQLMHQYPQGTRVFTRPVLTPEELTPTMVQAFKQLTHLPSQLRRLIIDVSELSADSGQVMLTTNYHHRLIVRADEIQTKVPLYASFQKHPPGTLYLLTSIWFEKEPSL
jgi:cell division septal protein FtsQ